MHGAGDERARSQLPAVEGATRMSSDRRYRRTSEQPAEQDAQRVALQPGKATLVDRQQPAELGPTADESAGSPGSASRVAPSAAAIAASARIQAATAASKAAISATCLHAERAVRGAKLQGIDGTRRSRLDRMHREALRQLTEFDAAGRSWLAHNGAPGELAQRASEAIYGAQKRAVHAIELVVRADIASTERSENTLGAERLSRSEELPFLAELERSWGRTFGEIDLGAPRSPGKPVPHLAGAERAFGRSFAHVEAFTGMGEELGPMGAKALTVGHHVAFAENEPSPELVTHELTHVAQNDQAGASLAMAAGVVAPRHSAAEAEADANAASVAEQGFAAKLPPVVARPAAHVHLAPEDGDTHRAPKVLMPEPGPPPRSTIVVPDADHPARRDADGELVIQTGQRIASGSAPPLRGKAWKSLLERTEPIELRDDSGDVLIIVATYRIESRPAEVGEIPDTWIHTERRVQLTIGTGEHASATITGQARIHLAPGELDPKAAIAKTSIGASHWAEVYLAEARQFVNVYGSGGAASLVADAAGSDVLAYDDPLRMLVGLKNILKQQHIAGHGHDVAQMHARAQRLLAASERGRAILQHEIEAIASSHDPHPGKVAPVRFLVGNIAEWLTANQAAGRDATEDARQLKKARAELEQLLADLEKVHAPKRDQLDDALMTPVRVAERTAAGVAELGRTVLDATALDINAIGAVTGIGTFDHRPRSQLFQAVESTGSSTAALVAVVNGFADEWSGAIERARNGDYRGLTDVSVDALMMIEGAHTVGTVAVHQAEALAAKLGSVAASARSVATSARSIATSALDHVGLAVAQARDIAAAMADAADAFNARLRAGGLQMATAGGGSGPALGGVSSSVVGDAAQAAKNTFQGKRAAPAKGASVPLAPTRELGLRAEAVAALESLENIKADPIGDINSQPAHNHYAAARREAAGDVVARRPDGRPFSHIGDLQRAYDGFSNIKEVLEREIAHPPNTITDRGLEVLIRKHSEVQRLMNRLAGFLNEIGHGRFPPYHAFPRGT